MTLKRLMIIVGILAVLVGGGIMWLWEYAYTPAGRARTIIAQLRGEEDTTRGWMLKHKIIREGYKDPLNALAEQANNPDTQAGDSVESHALAAEAMVKLGPSVLPFVLEALKNDNDQVKLMAIAACRKFRDPAAIEPLAQCMKDAQNQTILSTGSLSYGDQTIQNPCMEALLEMGPPAYEPMVKASRKTSIWHQIEIIKQLAAKEGAKVTPLLMQYLDDIDSSVTANAANEIGKLKDKRAVDALAIHLNDRDQHSVYWMARALGEIGDAKAIPSLRKALTAKRGPEPVPASVAVAMARMGQADGVAAVKQALLKSPTVEVRVRTADELGAVRFKEAWAWLLPALQDKDASVRSEVVDSLREIGDARAVPALKKLKNDPDSNVRDAVENALQALAPASQPAGN